jgi:hypothetical protein
MTPRNRGVFLYSVFTCISSKAAYSSRFPRDQCLRGCPERDEGFTIEYKWKPKEEEQQTL